MHGSWKRGRGDHRRAEGARGRRIGRRSGAEARCLGGDALQLEGQLYGGMDVSQAKPLKQLEVENAK